MREDNLKLDLVKGISVTVIGKDGKNHTRFLTSDILQKRIDSVMYQTLSNAVGRDVSELLNNAAFENIPKEEIFEDIKNNNTKVEGFIEIYQYTKDCYFYIKDKKYSYKSKEAAERSLQLAKSYYSHLKHKK